MKSIGMLVFCSLLAGSVSAQKIVKKKSGKKVPEKGHKLAGKNQNKIMSKYLLKNVVGGQRMGRGQGGRAIEDMQDVFYSKHGVEKETQWTSKEKEAGVSDAGRKLHVSYDIPGLSNVWSWDEGNGAGSASNRSCSEVCPETLEILTLNNEKFERKQENFLSFRNRAADMMDSYKRIYGYCWGHSSFSSSLKMFAFFDPANKAGEKVPSRSDRKAYKRYYGKIIKNLYNNKPQVIPYFSSINEFASDSLLKKEFKHYVAQRWGRLAVRAKNYKALDEMYKAAPAYKDYVEVFEVLKKKIGSMQAPRLNFHRFGSKAYSHVVTAIGVEQFKNGKYRIYTEDPNDFPKDIGAGKRYIEIQPTAMKQGGAKLYATYNFYDVDDKGISRYGAKGRIGKIKILDESDPFHEHSVSRLNKFCVKQSNCQK